MGFLANFAPTAWISPAEKGCLHDVQGEDDDDLHLEEGELLFRQWPDGAGYEGALGEATVELGKEGLIPGNLCPAQEALVPGHLLQHLLLLLLLLANCKSLGSLEHLKITRILFKCQEREGFEGFN